MSAEKLLSVERNGIEESVHRGWIAVVNSSGQVIAGAGDLSTVLFARSTAKPIQAIPLVEEGGASRFGLTAAELAVICSSHSGQADHVQAVRSILDKCGVEEQALQCGVHRPWNRDANDQLIASGQNPSVLHNNCSGKHAGMLALSVLLGADTSSYMDMDHPVQVRIRATVADLCGIKPKALQTGVDGCGVPVYAMPIQSLAVGLARFAASDALSRGRQEACSQLLQAMAAHPNMVAGDGRPETILMETSGSRFVAKSGAEGLMAVMIPERQWALVIKIEDGSSRGLMAVAVEALKQLELIDDSLWHALMPHTGSRILNVSGKEVGKITPVFHLR